jgi:hypothetical protein
MRTVPFRTFFGTAALTGLLFSTGTTSRAQVLPSAPVSIGSGRLVVSGEASAGIAPKDPGFFNYTDYAQNALRMLRLGVTTRLSLGPRAALLTEVRSETGNRFELPAMFLRVRPWESRSIDIQAGRIPPTFGAYPRRGYGADNALIGYPVIYQYLTSLRADALPANADDLLVMRGRGWRPAFPIGDQSAQPGLPLMSALRWDTGVQVRVGSRPLQFAAAITNGSLSNPLVVDDNGGKQLAGRMTYQPSAGLVMGVSAGRAAYLSRTATDSLPRNIGGHFTQEAVGADIEYSRDHWLVRAEGLLSQWRIPTIGAPVIDSPLRAVGLFVEGQYTLRPGFYLAGRADYLGFSDITGTHTGGQPTPWDFPVTRIEIGGGYHLLRNLIGKVAYQQNWRDDPFGPRTRFVATQVVYWF